MVTGQARRNLVLSVGKKHVEEIWRQFFSTPSQWWDHRLDKLNRRYPDFKHQTTGLPLWINGKSCPYWVKEELAAMMPGCVPRSPFSWNAKLSEYVKSNKGQEALEYFQQMQVAGINPDSFTFVMVANACASLASLEEGRIIHAQIIQSGFDSDVFVGNCLIDMYGKCGSIDDAQRVFNKMPMHDTVSWNSMLAGYVKCKEVQKVLELYGQMQVKEALKPDPVTLATVLNACASSRSLDHGRHVHAQVIQRYLKCEQGEWALELYQHMQARGVRPDAVTFTMILSASGSIGALEEGKRIHAEVIESGFESDIYVASSLVDMYSKCGSLDDACSVFNNMPVHDLVVWNTILAGYVKFDQKQKVFELYKQMQAEGVKPNTLTFVTVLNMCAKATSLEEGKHVHSQIIQSGCEDDLCVGNCLVDMYAKCRRIDDALLVFNNMPVHDLVSWNAMLGGYLKNCHPLKSLKLYRQMQVEGFQPNAITFSTVLNACASLGALVEGRYVHTQVAKSGYESDVFVASSLIDMYAKCGNIEDAWQVFNSMPAHDVVSWTTMLGGLAINGHGKEALQMFEEMCRAGLEMDATIFICLLSACSHAGLVEEGLHYFESMTSVYGVSRTADHYVCVVDLLGRAGLLDEAQGMIRNMSHEPNISSNEYIIAWRTLLSSCRNHQNLLIGECAVKQVLELDTNILSTCVAEGYLEGIDVTNEVKWANTRIVLNAL